MVIDTLVDATLDFLGFVFIEVIWEGLVHAWQKIYGFFRRKTL